MNRSLGWAGAMTVVGLGIAALLLALRGGDEPAPPSRGIVLGGDVSDDAVLRDPLVPPELHASPVPAPGTLTVAKPPPRGNRGTVTSEEPPADRRRRQLPRQVDHNNLPYLGYAQDDVEDESDAEAEEDCAPGPWGPVEWPEDVELIEIPGPDEVEPPPAESSVVETDPCEEPTEDGT